MIEIRSARAVRIHVPVAPATLAAFLAGKPAFDDDPVLAAMLAVIRADNPLGKLGDYTGVVEIAPGCESFVPGDGATPALGGTGAISLSPTIVLTTYLAGDADQVLTDAALCALLAAHPWETPIIEIAPIGLLGR